MQTCAVNLMHSLQLLPISCLPEALLLSSLALGGSRTNRSPNKQSPMVQRNAGVPQHHHGIPKAKHCTRLVPPGRARKEAGEEGFQPGESAGGGSQPEN